MIENRSGDPNFVLVDKRTYQEFTISKNENKFSNQQNCHESEFSFMDRGNNRFNTH